MPPLFALSQHSALAAVQERLLPTERLFEFQDDIYAVSIEELWGHARHRCGMERVSHSSHQRGQSTHQQSSGGSGFFTNTGLFHCGHDPRPCTCVQGPKKSTHQPITKTMSCPNRRGNCATTGVSTPQPDVDLKGPSPPSRRKAVKSKSKVDRRSACIRS